MKRLMLAFLTSLILAGCSSSFEKAVEASIKSGDHVTYMCGGEMLSVIVSDSHDDVQIWVGDALRTLWRTSSASGVKFSDGYYTFWAKGEQASVYKDDQVILTDCWLVH